MKLRNGDPWMPAEAYARTLQGLTLNLLVRNVDAALPFQREVLAGEIVYHDPDFAVVRASGSEWMLHADHAYLDHAFGRTVTAGTLRGAGVEIRLHGRDPDLAQAAALRLGYAVLAPVTDKPHGLREVFIVDADGYTWAVDVPSERRAAG